MHWTTWWQIFFVLYAQTLAQSITPTICDEEVCRCDSFTRVICNCTNDYAEVTFRPEGAYRLPTSVTAIIVDSCSRVFFLTDTIRNLIQLRNIEIRNVSHLMLNERALSWSPFPRENEMNPGIRIKIINSTVNEISSYAMQGRINDIIIRNSLIKNIKSFALSSLTAVKTIEFTDNVFDNIETQALKQFTTLNFLLRGGFIKILPTRFLSGVDVNDLFKMEGVTVENVFSLAFQVSSPKRVLIENNNIEVLEGDGFHVTTRGPITFRNNTVRSVRKGSFFGFTVDPEITSIMGPQDLLIDNNTVTEVTPSSLMYNRSTLTLRVDGLNLNAACACELAKEWRDILKEQGGIINCWYTLENYYVSLPTYVDSRCGSFKQNFWIFVVIGVVFIIAVAAVVIFFIVRREHEKKKKLQIVMPDGKTYRETELHIVVERAELLTTDL